MSRASDTGLFGRYCKALLPLFCAHCDLARVGLYFDELQPELFRDVLLRNPSPAIRASFANFLFKLVESLVPYEAGGYFDTEVRSVEETFVSGTQMENGAVVDVYSTRTVSRQVYSRFTSQFLARLVSTTFLDFACTAWRNFSEYFGLLLSVASLGRPQRQFMNEIGVDLLLLDAYLGLQSPLYGVGNLFDPAKRPREVMGTKQAKPDFTNLMATVSLLVRRVPAWRLVLRSVRV